MAISAAVAVGAEADRLMEQVDAQARSITVGSGRDAASEMGPIVTLKAVIASLASSIQARRRVQKSGLMVEVWLFLVLRTDSLWGQR